MNRYAVHNGAAVLTVLVALFLTQFLTDGPWLEVGLIVGGYAVLGVLLAAVVTPISRRRFEASRFKYVPPKRKPGYLAMPSRALPARAPRGEAA